jgi:hypothetical protein
MDNMIPVDGMDGYYRDIHSGAIVNTNNIDYETYVRNREKLREDKKKFDSI